MQTDFLSKIIEQKKEEVAAAQRCISEKELKEKAEQLLRNRRIFQKTGKARTIRCEYHC